MVKRPRYRYQDRSHAVRVIAGAAAKATQPSLKQALGALGDSLDMDKVRELIRHGRHRDIAHTAIDWHHFRQTLRHPYERLARAYEAGAVLGQRKINGAFAAKRRAVRYRKGGPSAVVLNGQDQGGNLHPGERRGTGSESDLSEALAILKRQSSVAFWEDDE